MQSVLLKFGICCDVFFQPASFNGSFDPGAVMSFVCVKVHDAYAMMHYAMSDGAL